MNQPVQPHPIHPVTAIARPARVAVIAASWHADIVQQAARACHERLQQLLARCEVTHCTVPGAFEIPLRAKRLAQSGQVDAIVACALVVDGGIYRHDFVASAVIDGLMRVQLDTLVPVFSVVLTPHHFHDRCRASAFLPRALRPQGRGGGAGSRQRAQGGRLCFGRGAGGTRAGCVDGARRLSALFVRRGVAPAQPSQRVFTNYKPPRRDEKARCARRIAQRMPWAWASGATTHSGLSRPGPKGGALKTPHSSLQMLAGPPARLRFAPRLGRFERITRGLLVCKHHLRSPR